MYVARLLYPVKVLGPGDRIGIWLAGCNHKCKGCSNPELWEQKDEYLVSLDTVIKMIKSVADKEKVDGFTITGGDPLYQADELKELVLELTKISEDILVYTGYEYSDIKDRYPEIFENIAVLIDGKYIEDRNKQEILRGSDNQSIIILNDKYKNIYDEYMASNISRIQNFTTKDGFISVGIHKPGYEADLDKKLTEKGMIKNG